MSQRSKITYDQQSETFSMRLETTTIPFTLSGRLYVADMSDSLKRPDDQVLLIPTVKAREENLPKKTLQRFKQIIDFVERLGYPSDRDVIALMEGGKILNCPYSARDLVRAREVYGPALGAIKGKTKRASPGAVPIFPVPIPLRAYAYVDASYGVHDDCKSHTGCVISLGEGPIFVKSSKLKSTTKSSTEAELMGLSDNLSQVIWARSYLAEQGYPIGPARLFQDNQGVLALLQRGRPATDATRHIAIRHFFAKERVGSGELILEYLESKLMPADILTKAQQGELFRTQRALLMGGEC